MLGWNFVILREGLNGGTGIVIKSLRFEEDCIASFVPEGIIFGLFPVKMVDFRIKIQEEKAEIMAGEIVFWAGVTEANDEVHDIMI